MQAGGGGGGGADPEFSGADPEFSWGGGRGGSRIYIGGGGGFQRLCVCAHITSAKPEVPGPA